MQNLKKEYVGQPPVYSSFKELIIHLLEDAGLTKEKIFKFSQDKYLKKFEIAFTHSSVDEINNYEFYETLGDAIVNHSAIMYYVERFPELEQPAGVKYLSLLKIHGVSKRTLGLLGITLGFFPHIKYVEKKEEDIKESKEQFQTKSKESIKFKLCEDVFEAFCGCLEKMVNSEYRFAGFGVVYTFIKKQFDKLDLSLEMSKIQNYVSNLKEVLDTRGFYRDKQNRIIKHHEYKSVPYKTPTGEEKQFVVLTLNTPDELINSEYNRLSQQKRDSIFTIIANNKKEGQQYIAKKVLNWLNDLGITKVYKELKDVSVL